MSKGGKAPAPPDYAAAAREQGIANLEAIRTGAALNRVNQTTPYGSVTYRQVNAPQTTQAPVNTGFSGGSLDFGGDFFGNPALGSSVLADALRNYQTSGQGSSGGSDQWEQITTLSPDQQAILDAQERNQIDMGGIANNRLNQFGSQGPLNFGGLPARVSGVQPSNFQTNISSPGTRYSDIDLAKLSGFGDGQVQRSVDLSGLPEIPGINDFGAERQKVEDALYGRATSRLDPQFQQREEAARTRLINSGNVQGSEAWNTEMANLERERQDAYDQARSSAIMAGGNEQSRLLSGALAARGQTSGELFGQGQFTNQAAGQINTEAADRRSQMLSEILSQGQFGNQAANQQLQAELSKAGLINAAESDRFAQGVTNANLSGSARDAGINEQIMLRDRPLQEFLQLFGGSNGSGFNAPGIPQAGTPEAPDIMGATQAGYQGRLDQYSANQARNAQQQQSLLGLASIFAMSDRFAKRDIERVGTLQNGLPTYRFKYLDDDTPRIGVMADEVRERFPDAVITGFDGFARVNYAAIGAEHLLEAQ